MKALGCYKSIPQGNSGFLVKNKLIKATQKLNLMMLGAVPLENAEAFSEMESSGWEGRVAQDEVRATEKSRGRYKKKGWAFIVTTIK